MSPGAEDDDGDLTRKQRREQARGERKALEQAEADRAKRRTRLTQLGIVVAIVVVVIVGIAIASGGGSKKTVTAGSHESNATVAEVKTLIDGIPQSGNTLGDPNAPVTLRYFGDLECPICKEFTLEVLPTLIPKFVRTGKLKIEYHSLETATREPEIFKDQQEAAYAAGKQNLAWYFIETFYHEQGEEDSGYVNEKYLQGIAAQVPGLNLSDWSAARSEPTYSNEVEHDAQAANAAGFTGTPSFELGKTGGTLEKFEPGTYTEAAPYEAAIEKLLKS
jgi:protein-disulfide isomerase